MNDPHNRTGSSWSHRLLDATVLVLAAWTLLCNTLVIGGQGFGTLMTLAPVAVLAGLGAWWWVQRSTPEDLPFTPETAARAPRWWTWLLAAQAVMATGLLIHGPFRRSMLVLWFVLVTYFLLAWAVARSQPEDPTSPPHGGQGWLWALALLAALFGLFVHRESLDDALYINFAVAALDEPGAALLRMDTLHERRDLPIMFSLYRMHSLELGAAALARVTGLACLTVFHVVFPALFGLLSTLAYARLHRFLVPRAWLLATFATMVILAACGQGRQSFEIHFLRLSQGKSLVLVLFLPLLIVYAARFARSPTGPRWLLLMAAQVAAAGCSANGAWVLPAVAGLSLVAFLPGRLLRIHSLRVVGLGMLASMLVLGLTWWHLRSQPPRLFQSGSVGTNVAASLTQVEYGQEVIHEAWRKMFGGGNRGWAAWTALLLAGLACRTRRGRLLASVLPLGLLLVFLDPFLATTLSSRLIGRPVFVRVLWVLPWPALAALVLLAPFQWWPRARGAGVLLVLGLLVGYVVLVPSRHPFDRDTVRLGFGGLTLPEPQLAAARLLTEHTPAGTNALAAEGVATWLVCVEGHPRPIVCRRLYLQYQYRRLGAEEVRVRQALYDLVTGKRTQVHPDLLRNGIGRFQLGGVCLNAEALDRQPTQGQQLREVLADADFVKVGEAGAYEVWCLESPAPR